MDNVEAISILRDYLRMYRQHSYGDLVELVGTREVAELGGPSGAVYQIEVAVHWDHRPGGAIRVLGAVDDGGWRAVVPLTDDFILAPDGTFIGK
jgi:hypothetical protein